MILSRRMFVAQGSAALATASLPSALPQPRRSAKKGLAGIAPEVSGLATSWYYSWRLHPSTTGMPAHDASMQFHPMCWGWKPAKGPEAAAHAKPDDDGSTPAGVESLRAEHPPVLFGFNEPDKPDQSNLTVDQAVAAWPSLTGIARELVGPSCAKPNSDWMAKFVPAVEQKKLQLDSLGYHHYGSPSVDAFAEHLEAFYKTFQRPVWVTEFAVADWDAKGGKTNRFTVDATAEFMKGALAFLETTPWISGYAWFPRGGKFATGDMKGPLATSVLFNADGTLTQLGKLYQSL